MFNCINFFKNEEQQFLTVLEHAGQAQSGSAKERSSGNRCDGFVTQFNQCLGVVERVHCCCHTRFEDDVTPRNFFSRH